MATTLYTIESPQYNGKNGSTGKYIYNATVTLNSQSVVNNTSNITVLLTLKSESNSGTTLWSASAASNQPYATLSGDVNATGNRIAKYSKSTTPVELVSWTGDILHNSDGTKSITINFNWVAGGLVYYPASFTIFSPTINLPTIARASTVTTTSATIKNNTGSLQYTVTSNGLFYHTLTYNLGGTTGTVFSNRLITSTYTNTISYSTLLNAMPTISTGTLTLTLKTFSSSSGTTQIGSDTTATATITIDTSIIKPDVSLTSISINESTPLSGYAIAGYNKLKVAYSVLNSAGASGIRTTFSASVGTMATQSITTPGSGNVLTNTLPASTTSYGVTITATSVDSRGATNTATITSPTIYGYIAPSITINAYRCTSNGTADEAGTYVKATFSATYSLVAQGNAQQSITCTKNGAAITSGGVYSLPLDETAEFLVTARDKVSTNTKTALVNTAEFPLDLYDDGNGNIGGAFGSVAEANKLKIGLDVYGTTNTVAYKHQITTSFKNAVAMGSYGTAQTTLDGFVNEIKFSNGATGSFSLNTAYTRDGITIPTGWYNFIFSPHRTGGLNGGANGDNTNYGNLILMGMTGTRKVYKIRVSGGYVDELITSSTVTDFSNAIAKGETKYTGTITWESWVAAKTENELIRIGNVVQCRIRWKSAADTNTNSPQVGTIPNGFKPALQFYAQANVCWSNVQVPISINPTSGVITHMNKVYAINTSYTITATWLTSDDYPS